MFFEPGRQTAVVTIIAVVAEVVSDDVPIAIGEIHPETLRMVIVFPFPRLWFPFAVIGILRLPVSIFLFPLSSFGFVPVSILRLAVPIFRLPTSRFRFCPDTGAIRQLVAAVGPHLCDMRVAAVEGEAAVRQRLPAQQSSM